MGLRGTNWHQGFLWKSVGREGQATHKVGFYMAGHLLLCPFHTLLCAFCVLGHSMCSFLIQRETGMSSVSLILSVFFCHNSTNHRSVSFPLSSAHLLLWEIRTVSFQEGKTLVCSCAIVLPMPGTVPSTQ